MEFNNSDDIPAKYAKHRNNLRHIEKVAELPPEIIEWIDKNTDAAFLLVDSKGKLLFATPSIEKIMGYKPSELIGTFWYEKVPEDDINYVRNQKNGESTNVSFNVLNNDGRYVRLDCTYEHYVDVSDDTAYILVLLRDVTYKQETEEMMVRSEKMNIAGQLAAGIAHEIRNPLTSLKGFLQLLQAGVSHKEEYFNVMIEEIDKIESITSELLFISKPLTNNRKQEPVDKMIEDVIVLLEPQAKLKNIELTFERPIHAEILCDRSQIKQVLINLVKNAIEAMNSGGRITLSVCSFDDRVEILVADEGEGIPEEILHKLGEPFFTTKQSGTGLGLVITKQILDAHDATLNIQSNSLKGTTFQLAFPQTI
ncbi:ATP-binding protein [Oceanobacillus massiliensis]|uniref:ATP-binding protein n=1 Tax=Oceanobacillus massiliensis TaxID=1465765 RepID=UPI00301AB671